MNKYIYIFFLIIICASLFIYERVNMFASGIVESTGYVGSVCVLIMMLLSFLGTFFWGNALLKNAISKNFTICILITYVISLLYSLFYPFANTVIYIEIILPLFMFYFISMYYKYVNNDDLIIWIATIITILLSIYFINNYQNNIFYDIESQNNASYVILYLLPFLLCHKKYLFRIISIFLVLIVVMLSLKRGGFIALILSTISYFFVQQKIKSKYKINFTLIITLLPIFLGLYYLVIYLDSNYLNGNLFSRLQESMDDGGSGRIDVYKYYLDSIGDSSFFYFLFGRGWNGSLRVGEIGLSCHNDFLEVFIDFGLIGFIFYFAFFISLIRLTRRMIKIKHEYAPAMAASVMMFFVNSMVAHIYIYSKYMILFVFFWGFIIQSVRKSNYNIL